MLRCLSMNRKNSLGSWDYLTGRIDSVHHKNPAYRDPAAWSPYVLAGK
jgi:hypothetical protein